jgi:hypothetical protein
MEWNASLAVLGRGKKKKRKTQASLGWKKFNKKYIQAMMMMMMICF